LGRSTNVFTNCSVLFTLLKAIEGNIAKSMMALALATHLSMYPALLLPPVILLSYDQHWRGKKLGPNGVSFSLKCISIFVVASTALTLMSYVATDFSWEYLSSTYGNHILVTDLTPNVGLWWYFLIEMFDSFREFFLGVFWLHLGAYVSGLSVRIRRQPLFVAISMLGVFAIFKPYPSISDASLFLSTLPLYRHVFPRKYISEPMVGALIVK
jgi:GPI-anchor transamidase subunit U